MKIAFYHESSNDKGGVNRVVSLIASGLARRGHEVHIISRYEGKSSLYALDERVKLHELYPKFVSKYKSLFSEYWKLKRIVREHHIDILVSAGGAFFLIAGWIKGVRHFEWDHTSYNHGDAVLQWGRRLAVRRAEKVIVLTEDNRKFFLSLKGCRAKVCRIFNPSTFQMENVIPASQRENMVLAVGFIGKQKGYDLLVKAWSMLPCLLRDKWKLFIVGDDREKMLDELRRFCGAQGLNNVSFLGYRKDIPELMKRAAFYVMSSRWEGLPMVLIEAQAAGLPIVAFDCKTGPRDVVIPGSGLLASPEDISDLAVKIEKMMSNLSLRESCSQKALESSTRFELEKIIDCWETELAES